MAEKELNIYQRLLLVQKELVAPRSKVGRFGNARSAEQILEAAKPLCIKHGLYLFTSDKVELFGERNYITTTAVVFNVDKPDERHHAIASAWENTVSGGLDTAQVSGKTSSYAKKYALQNLFAIDDTKDADHDDEPQEVSPASEFEKAQIRNLLSKQGIDTEFMKDALITQHNIKNPTAMTSAEAQRVIKELQNAGK